MKVKAYEVVCEPTAGNLVRQVQLLIQNGWQPYGDPSVRDRVGWVQFVVKYSDD